MSLRARRLGSEWQLLKELAGANAAVIAQIDRFEDEFHVMLRNSPTWVSAVAGRQMETSHTVRYVYPRYYPTLPLEAYLTRPVLHINVDHSSGFVCLWSEYRSQCTIVDAILTTRAVLAWQAANWDPAHRMQPDAFTEAPEERALPLCALEVPSTCRSSIPPTMRSSKAGRRRLSSALEDQPYCGSDLAFSDTK
jgi:ubiquitin-protein ligase